MRRPSLLLVLTAVIGLVLAACASPAGSPGASGGGEPSSAAGSEAPAGSDDGSGGGGGGGGSASGSLVYDISGDYSASGELPYQSIMGGYLDLQGVTYLPFAETESSDEVAFITLSDEQNIFAFGNGEFSVPAADCDWNVTRNDATGAAGSFECTDAMGIHVGEQTFVTVDISGSFDTSN